MRPARKSLKFIAPALFGFGFYCYQKRVKRSSVDLLKIGCAGALTQCASEVLFHFVDTVNVRCKGAQGRITSYSLLKSLLNEKGPKGLLSLFAGVNATFYASTLGGIVYFTLYKTSKSWIKKIWKTSKPGNDTFGSFLRYFVSAIMAEIVALTVYFPFELIKTRIQTSNHIYKYTSLPNAFGRIGRSSVEQHQNPLRAFYSGCAPFFAMFTLYTAIQFTCYEEMMRIFKVDQNSLQSEGNGKLISVFTSSVISGAIASLLTNWLEVFTIKRQINPKARIKDIWHEEGIAIFTKGILPRTLFNMCQSAMIFSLLGFWCNNYGIEFDG